MIETKILLMLTMFVFGILETIVAFVLYMREKEFKLLGIETEAKIIKLEKIGRNYRPILEYKTAEGIVEKKSKSSSSKIFFPFDEGDIVNIYYDKNNLERYRFENDKVWSFLIMILFLTAILCLILGCVFYFIF